MVNKLYIMRKVPVLFIIFCREDVTLKSFEAIKEYKPDVLYIAGDGPRANRPGETDLCEQTRAAVLAAVNWDCRVETLFRDHNLGCTMAVSSAISWFFSNEEYGIIIEDDCFIHHDFFSLCEKLLPEYSSEDNVMLVSAQNQTPDLKHANQLVFSNGCFIWGWASWRRAWNKMDMNLELWPQFKFKKFVKKFGLPGACHIYLTWRHAYRNTNFGSWDLRWFFAVLANDGLCLSSNVNLSKNIGIEIGGAHYEQGDTDPFEHIPFGDIKWPIIIPDKIERSNFKMKAEKRLFYKLRIMGLKKKIKKIFTRG